MVMWYTLLLNVSNMQVRDHLMFWCHSWCHGMNSSSFLWDFHSNMRSRLLLRNSWIYRLYFLPSIFFTLTENYCLIGSEKTVYYFTSVYSGLFFFVHKHSMMSSPGFTFMELKSSGFTTPTIYRKFKIQDLHVCKQCVPP